MRLERVTLRGVLQTAAPITLDLAAIPPGLVAVVGANGSGKTTLVEAPIAALYRTFPSRAGELVDYATTRDAYLEAVFSVDARGTYRARVNLDGTKRAADAVLEHTAPDGVVRLLNDGKLTTYDAAVAAVFPPLEVLLASAVAAQNRAGSFVTLDKRGRKDLFQTLLGLDRYEAMATTARQAGQVCERALVALQAQRTALAPEAAPSIGVHLRGEIARTLVAQHDVAAAIAGFDDDRARLSAARQQHAEAASAHRLATARLRDLATEAAAQITRMGGLRRQAEAARAAAADERTVLDGHLTRQLADLDAKIANNRALVARAAEVRAAVEAERQARAALARIDEQLRASTLAGDDWRAALSTAERSVHEAELAVHELTRAQAAAARLAGVCDACTFVADARAAQARIPALQALADDLPRRRDVAAALETEGRERRAAHQRLVEAAQAQRQALVGHETTARLLPTLEAAEARIAELTRDRAATEAQHAGQARALEARLALTLDDLTTQRLTIDAAIDRVAAETAARQAEADATASAAARLAACEAELAAVDRQRDQYLADQARLDAAADALEERLAAWTRRGAQLETLAGQIGAVEAERREWVLLARALGRDGLPVLEIDAAGPTVSAYANDLLAACFGPRFTVELITQAEKADGKGTKEVFELRVLDNLRGGAARDLTDLSGGEQVLVDEALKNALALFLNRRAGGVQTLWRDETTSPLDGENGLRYVEMLRRVRTLAGVRHILFVSHQPAAAALADVQVQLADGALTVRRPPFREAA